MHIGFKIEVCTKLELFLCCTLYNQEIKYVQPILKDNSSRISLPLSPSILSSAFKYSSTVYQTSHQRQAFHKTAYIIQVKILTTHIHRHHNKCPTRLNLDLSTQPYSNFSSFSMLFSFQTVHPCLPFPQRPHFYWLSFSIGMIILKIPTFLSIPIKLVSSLCSLYFSYQCLVHSIPCKNIRARVSSSSCRLGRSVRIWWD